MAITCALTLNAFGGLEVPAAYVRVTTAEAYKVNVQPDPELPRDERLRVKYRYEVYMDARARQDAKNALDHGVESLAWDVAAQPNILAASYAHLKAQAAYAAATDC